MNFKKSHIDNKGFGDTKNGLDGHGFEPHLDHQPRNHAETAWFWFLKMGHKWDNIFMSPKISTT